MSHSKEQSSSLFAELRTSVFFIQRLPTSIDIPYCTVLYCQPHRICIGDLCSRYDLYFGRAMARRSVVTETQLRCQSSRCGICGTRSGTRTVFSPSTKVVRKVKNVFQYKDIY